MNIKVQQGVLQGFDGPLFPPRLKYLEDLFGRGDRDVSRALELMGCTTPVAGFIEMRGQPHSFWNFEYKAGAGRIAVLSSDWEIALYRKGVVDDEEVEDVVERLISAVLAPYFNPRRS